MQIHEEKGKYTTPPFLTLALGIGGFYITY
jgi:hypothetical protein